VTSEKLPPKGVVGGTMLSFELHDKHCYYATEKLKGTNTATETRSPLQLGFEQVLKRDEAEPNSPECPRRAKVSFSIGLVYGEEGELVEQQI
jgi:hypothetical protein